MWEEVGGALQWNLEAMMNQETVPLKLSQDTSLKGMGNIPIHALRREKRKRQRTACMRRIDWLTHAQMLPLGLSTSASHYSVTASRHRVMRSTAESQSAAHWEKDREAEAGTLTLRIMFDVSQRIVFHHSGCVAGFSLCLITRWVDEDTDVRSPRSWIFHFCSRIVNPVEVNSW